MCLLGRLSDSVLRDLEAAPHFLMCLARLVMHLASSILRFSPNLLFSRSDMLPNFSSFVAVASRYRYGENNNSDCPELMHKALPSILLSIGANRDRGSAAKYGRDRRSTRHQTACPAASLPHPCARGAAGSAAP